MGRDAADTPFVVVDTTGLVHGPGRILKAYQIDSIKPDALVCIEHHYDLEPLVRSHRTYNIIRIRASRWAVSKSREERAAARERAFRTYFERAAEVIMKMPGVIFQRFPILGGVPIEVDGYAYAEEYPDGIVAVSDTMEEGHQHGMTVLPSGFERNLLCGVLDSRSEVKGLALLKELDFGGEMVSLFTPVQAGNIKIIQGGDLYLDREGRELGYRRTET